MIKQMKQITEIHTLYKTENGEYWIDTPHVDMVHVKDGGICLRSDLSIFYSQAVGTIELVRDFNGNVANIREEINEMIELNTDVGKQEFDIQSYLDEKYGHKPYTSETVSEIKQDVRDYLRQRVLEYDSIDVDFYDGCVNVSINVAAISQVNVLFDVQDDEQEMYRPTPEWAKELREVK